MMSDFETWAYRIIIAGCCGVIFYIVKSYSAAINKKFDDNALEAKEEKKAVDKKFDQLMDKMDKLIGEISALRLSNASYDERFAGMNNRMLDMNKDIAVLQADVKILTHNYDSCQYCGNKNKQ